MPWKPETETCAECGYVWSIPLEEAVRLVEEAPERFADLFAVNATAKWSSPGSWSSTSYLWHVVDVLRFGTERLWTLALDADAGVPGWDQEAVAWVRHYEELSPKVGLRALQTASRDWTEAARGVPPDASVKHPVFGALTASDSIGRNAHEVRHHAMDVQRLRTWV